MAKVKVTVHYHQVYQIVIDSKYVGEEAEEDATAQACEDNYAQEHGTRMDNVREEVQTELL